MRFLLILCLIGPAWSQSVTETVKAQWLMRNGLYLDNVRNEAAVAFAMLESGRVDSGWVNNYVQRLLADESWWSGNRGAGLLAAQLCLWQKAKLPAGAYRQLWQRLLDLCDDPNYFAQPWNNGQINCMAVRYLVSQFQRADSVRYDYIFDPDHSGDFSFEGRNYRRGQIYNVHELSRAWLKTWMQRYIAGGYIHGELFSETYGHHYLNALITLADTRATSDPQMREHAAMTADFFLVEHGINTNGHHLAGPLGRTYMQSHLYGRDFFFPFEVYFGAPHPTHYGHSGSYYVSNYRLPLALETLVQRNLPRVVTSSVQGERYAWITERYTLGSSPGNGNWLLEINSNDDGPYPQARPGFNFRLWLNGEPNDLTPDSCRGECYAQMGMGGRQYKNSLLVAMPGAKLYEALAGNRWDTIENTSGWRFSVENGVAVAIRIDHGAAAAAVEVSLLGVDEADFNSFKAAVLANSKIISMDQYITRRGEKIEVQNNRMFVDGKAFNQNLPRLRVVDMAGKELIGPVSGKVFRLGPLEYDFDKLSLPARFDHTRTPPAVPKNVKIGL